MQGLTKVDTISDCKVCTYSLSLLSLYLIIYLPYKRAFCSINEFIQDCYIQGMAHTKKIIFETSKIEVTSLSLIYSNFWGTLGAQSCESSFLLEA